MKQFLISKVQACLGTCLALGSADHLINFWRKDHILGRFILGCGCGSLRFPDLQLTMKEHFSDDFGTKKVDALGCSPAPGMPSEIS